MKYFKVFASIFIIALIAAVICSLSEQDPITSAINYITAPMQKTAAEALDGASHKSYSELERIVAELESENAALRTALANYYDTQRENEQLRKFFGLKEENKSLKLLPAQTIRRAPLEDFYSFTINVGSSHGVSRLDPVVSEQGLVGYISSVNLTTATVRTILSPQIKVGVSDSRTATNAVLTGNVNFCDSNLTTLTAIPEDGDIKIGDIVTTSGLSELFPQGLVVGKVVETAKDSFDSTDFAVIEPFEDIRTVSHIAVITDF